LDKVVVGLGNPGSRYEGTRHNLGWMVADRLAERAGSTGYARARDGAASVRAKIDDLELLLVKPTTYMNLSGGAVRTVLARERVPIRDLLVVVDDFALPFGRLRIRDRGSDGGHNGLRSIIGELDTQGFARLRIGIGEPARGAARTHVLADFGPEERARLDRVLDAAADCVVEWAKHGPDRAATRWNGWRPDEEAAETQGDVDDPTEPQADVGDPTEPRGDVGDPTQPQVAPPTPPPSDDGTPEGAPKPAPDAEGIVRTATGWRRLLRRPGHDSTDDA
jgi:peptidyl-tRNA hydrolase, PTH1 family